MNKVRAVKILSLFAAMSTGLAMLLTGNIMEGVGVITASLASVSAFNPE